MFFVLHDPAIQGLRRRGTVATDFAFTSGQVWLVVGVTVRPKHDATARITDLARQCVAHHQEWTGEAPRYQSTRHFTGKQFQFSKCSMAVRPVPMCLILVWAMHPKKEIYSNAFRQHVELFYFQYFSVLFRD